MIRSTNNINISSNEPSALDYIELLKVALNCAKNRVVLKQPRYADPIEEIRKCSHQILGKTIRYDVFMTN